MELKLESGLPHQEYAVEAISEVFKQVEINQQVAHYSNPVIDLRSNRFIGNIYRIQQREQQNVAEKYRNEQPVGNTLCLDIKMETGTGKTYVYTHTIFELHKRYGINKFIIAVPSIAIKAGTSTFLNETYVKAHFKNTLGYDAEINVSVLEAVKNRRKAGNISYCSARLRGRIKTEQKQDICADSEQCFAHYRQDAHTQ